MNDAAMFATRPSRLARDIHLAGLEIARFRRIDAVYSSQVAEAVEIEAKAMPIRPFLLYAISLLNVKQAWRIIDTTRSCVVTMWSDGAKRRASRLATRSSMANVYPRWTATAIAEHSPAPRRPVADREAKRRSSSVAATGMRVSAPESSAGSEASLLIGISVRYFVGNMVGGEEGMGMPAIRSILSMRRKLIRTEASVTMIAGRSSSGESLTCLEPLRQD